MKFKKLAILELHIVVELQQEFGSSYSQSSAPSIIPENRQFSQNVF